MAIETTPNMSAEDPKKPAPAAPASPPKAEPHEKKAAPSESGNVQAVRK